METYSNKILEYHRIDTPTEEILTYINNRRKGISESLRTKWNKFNRLLGGGLEQNTLYTVAGISGSGKTSFVTSLESDIFELNPKANIVVLSFSFEMKASRIVGKKLSYKLSKSTTELYNSSYDTTVNDDYFNKVKEAANEIKKHEIYYVDNAGTVEEVRNTILHFNKTIAKNKWLIITLDHTLLTKGKTGEAERNIIADLQYMFIEIKKYDKNTIIQLSQLNRDIESSERITNRYLHFPIRKDLFGSDSVYQASDIVMVIHRPELLQIEEYGPGKHSLPTKNLIYLHIIKFKMNLL